jgi:hypothetical protein
MISRNVGKYLPKDPGIQFKRLQFSAQLCEAKVTLMYDVPRQTECAYRTCQISFCKMAAACMSVNVFYTFLKGHILLVTAEIWRKP